MKKTLFISICLKIFHYPSEELFTSQWVLFIRKEDTGRLKFDSFNDLQGKRIGVIKGYNYTSEFWNFLKKEQNYEEVTTEKMNFRKLSRKRIDYIVSEYGVGLAVTKKLGMDDQFIALTENPIKVKPQYIIFSKKTVTGEFVGKFSNELKSFKATPQYKTITEKYLLGKPGSNH